ncbi:MAG: hydroxyacylglutathione hydrolase [Rhodocyclaceae bacterium]|jgi:hydroxyacylglutathione hydrolase|nr:hydroxyacylglutathione hydrolase [Rhodocyclaceae bacterium]
MQIEPIKAFEDNYIWALRHGGQLAVVDPGDAAPVLRFIEQTGDRLCAILVTHRHGDHIGGIAELVARCPVPVFGPTREAGEVVTQPLHDGDTVHIPGLGAEFTVIEVPGHTLGHIAYYRLGMLFCGDTVFGAGCGRVFEGTMTQMQSSLARLAALPPETLVYCAHEYTQSCLRFAHMVEPDNANLAARSAQVAELRAKGQPSVPSTLAEELATNPFLRWQSPAVIAAAATRLGHAPASDVATFGAIRLWRDSL